MQLSGEQEATCLLGPLALEQAYRKGATLFASVLRLCVATALGLVTWSSGLFYLDPGCGMGGPESNLLCGTHGLLLDQLCMSEFHK